MRVSENTLTFRSIPGQVAQSPSPHPQQPFHTLVEQGGEHRHDQALEQIKGHHGKKHQGGHAVDHAIDRRSHGHQLLQGQAVEGGEGGEQIHRVEEAAEGSHHHRTGDHASDGPLLGLKAVIEGGGGENEGAAHHKVGKVAHEGGGGALEQQLEDDLHQLAHHARHRAQGEGADEHGHLAQVDLIEAGSEGQGKLQVHQDSGHGGKDTDVRRPPGALLPGDLQPHPFHQHGHYKQGHKYPQAYQKIHHIVLCAGPQVRQVVPHNKKPPNDIETPKRQCRSGATTPFGALAHPLPSGL